MNAADLPPLLARSFTERLMRQRQASPHTIASYRTTFRLLLRYARQQRNKPPTAMTGPGSTKLTSACQAS